jgi:ribonuclease-3
MSRGGDESLLRLEARIGHSFADRSLLRRALTHTSAVNGKEGDYERLEFLGDRVLGLIIADMLLRRFPKSPEGELSPRLAALVRGETCAAVATSLDLGAALATGPSNSRTAATQSMLGDACEALIGALYLDGGLSVAQQFIEHNWNRLVSDAKFLRDAKSTLQEWVQAKGRREPKYEIIEKIGPDHALRFRIQVNLDGFEPAVGEGMSRREAEQQAAAAVLVREGIWKAGEAS